MKECFVGFDTSNYTTSAAVCDAEGRVIANIKIPLPVKEGERGLRQSEAVFEHVRNLPSVAEQLGNAIKGYTPVAVGVSTRPRDAEGSYMPCFLSGKSAAYSFAAVAGVPVYELSHQNGHVMAALYSADKLGLLESDGFIAFHVSGGTTEALLVRPSGSGFSVELVGQTDDINAGQAIDRIGVFLGLRFPCGAQLEALAAEYNGKIHSHGVCVRDGVCSLSGVENIAKKLYQNGADKQAVAAFVFDFIGRTLEKMCADVLEKYGERPVIFAGGVMSNKLMRDRLSARFDAYFSEPQFSADNAAGIALLARREHIYKQK
ncbi:MAG: peptidase M22 [Ruminococcaceae bacterium]|nr:peptidase M22 [Oscillospiraceae bacterium]